MQCAICVRKWHKILWDAKKVTSCCILLPSAENKRTIVPAVVYCCIEQFAHSSVVAFCFAKALFTRPKKTDSLRRILRAGIVYLIIPRLTAFASFHTTQCNNLTNVPRDECTDIAGYHWTIEFSVLIIASTSEMITFHLRAVRGVRVWHRCQPFCGCIPYTRTHRPQT